MPHHLCSLYHCCDQIPEETHWKGGEALPLSQQFGRLRAHGRVERFTPCWPKHRDIMDQEHSLQRHLLTVCLTPMELCPSHVSELIPSHSSATHTWNKQEGQGPTLLVLFKFKTDFHFTSPIWLKFLSTHDFRIKYLCNTHQFAIFLIFFLLVVVLYVYNIEEGCVVEKSWRHGTY